MKHDFQLLELEYNKTSNIPEIAAHFTFLLLPFP